MNINELIGKRLAKAIARSEFRSGRAFGEELSQLQLGGWNRQTVSEAITGKRVFRVGELIGLAHAADVPAYFLLDAGAEGVGEVELAAGCSPITAGELYSLFGSMPPTARSIPAAVQTIHARKFLRQLRDSLKVAEESAATVDRFLRLIQPAEGEQS
jgi:hypothetical protein